MSQNKMFQGFSGFQAYDPGLVKGEKMGDKTQGEEEEE
jgi:hypothetical protein